MAAKETPWGTWDHLPLPEVVAFFSDFGGPWWIAGGYAIDAFAGGNRREHDDIDVSIFAADSALLRRHLADWEPQVADPPGSLRAWPADETLPQRVHDIWVRRDGTDAWRFQVMLNPGGPDEFICRRDERIRMPLSEATWSKDGVRYLQPEIQLFFKAKGMRPKDEREFRDCLPLFEPQQRDWLRAALDSFAPAHPWIADL